MATGNMIDAKEIKAERDEYGMWMHPAFPWNEIPEDADVKPYFKEWGYECCFRSLENDASAEVSERYINSDDPDCSYWEPTKPSGDGWFMGAIYDTDDGPVALWLHPIAKNTE